MKKKASSDIKTPKVSCLMVTANRKNLLRRSVHCFLNQDYLNKELVVVDDGDQDLSNVLCEVPNSQLRYFKLDPSQQNTLGMLRNFAIQKATGRFLTQWDDDDWYHPQRIKMQVQILQKGFDACFLRGTIMHLRTHKFINHPYIGILPNGFAGSIMHRRDNSINYPHMPRGEDTVYLQKWKEKRYKDLSREFSYLYVYSFHGTNTWEKNHFIRRIRNSPGRFMQYIWYNKIKGALLEHPVFSLTKKERQSFQMFMKDSNKFDLMHPLR